MKEMSYRDSHASDTYGYRYSNTYNKGYYFHQWKKIEEPILRKLLGDYSKEGKKTALDFACGTGRILHVLENYFQEPTGVDVSSSMLQHAHQKCLKSKVILQDITMEPLPVSVDLVTAFRFFLNAELPLKESALKAIHNVLNPSGVLVANVHVNASSILGMVYMMRNTIKNKKTANILSYNEFSQLLECSGFSIDKTIWYSYLPRPGWWAGYLCGKVMQPFENVCKRIKIPKQFAQCFIVCAKKN